MLDENVDPGRELDHNYIQCQIDNDGNGIYYFTFKPSKEEAPISLSVYSLIGYIYWFMYYCLVKKPEDLYNNLPSVMERPEVKDLMNGFFPVISVCPFIVNITSGCIFSSPHI